MHGVRRELLAAQAASIGLPLTTIELPEQPSMSEYDSLLHQKISSLKQQGFTHSIFGDIFLEDLKNTGKTNCSRQESREFSRYGKLTPQP
jgi:diphthamide synthase (EF-2-diphthine--ammonia ligase)